MTTTAPCPYRRAGPHRDRERTRSRHRVLVAASGVVARGLPPRSSGSWWAFGAERRVVSPVRTPCPDPAWGPQDLRQRTQCVKL